MPKITRYTGNLDAFASTALSGERNIFGEETESDDLTENITSKFLRGLEDGLDTEGFPTMQWFNAAFFVSTQLSSYLHQAGVAEYEPLQIYYTNSFCNYNGILYASLTDDNTGNSPDSSPSEWKSIYESPELTGTPTAPTAAPGNDSTQIATTAYVDEATNSTLEIINIAYPIGTVYLDGSGTLTPPGQGVSGITWVEVTESEGHILMGHSAAGGWAVAPGSVAGSLITTDGHGLTEAENGPHAHGVTDPGHTHPTTPPTPVVYHTPGSNGGTAGGPMDTGVLTVGGATANISINSSGSGQAHSHGLTEIQRFGVKIWKRTA